MGSTVAVVIPTRNRARYLEEAIASVLAQTFTDWRLVIIDDASEDETPSIVQRYLGDRVSGIRLEEHGERSAARNRGLAEAQEPFVLFLDDDDRLTPRALAVLVAALRSSTDAVAAVGNIAYIDDEGRDIAPPRGARNARSHPRRKLKRDVWTDAVWGWVAQTGRVLFRSERVTSAGGFQQGLVAGEDRDLWLRIARSGPALFVPDVALYHRIHPGQWRPAGPAMERHEDITRRHLDALPDDERAVGERILVAKSHFRDARSAWIAGRPRDATRSFLGMRIAPVTLLASPITRAQWTGPFVRAVGASVLGRRGLALARRLTGASDRSPGRF